MEGLRLRCRAHNQYEADRVFGPEFMRQKRLEADLLSALRSLGCRGELARRAAEFSQTVRGTTLEDRLRAALQFVGRRSAQGLTPADVFHAHS